MFCFLFLLLVFIIVFFIKRIVSFFKYKINNNIICKERQKNSKSFAMYLKSARVFNIDFIKKILKTNYLGENSFCINQNNINYYVFDNYLENEDNIYLYRMVYSLDTTIPLFEENLVQNIFKFKDLNVNQEQLVNIKTIENIENYYLEDYINRSSFCFYDYYFEEKFFKIPSKKTLINNKIKNFDVFLNDLRTFFENFLDEIDIIDFNILFNEVFENTEYLLDKLKKDSLNNYYYEISIDLLKEIKLFCKLVLKDKYNIKNIEKNIKNIEFNLNALSNLLEE